MYWILTRVHMHVCPPTSMHTHAHFFHDKSATLSIAFNIVWQLTEGLIHLSLSLSLSLSFTHTHTHTMHTHGQYTHANMHTHTHAYTHHPGETEQEEQGYKQNLLFICSITLFSASYIVPIPDFLLLSFFEKFFSLGLHLLLGQPALEGLLIFFGLKHR